VFRPERWFHALTRFIFSTPSFGSLVFHSVPLHVDLYKYGNFNIYHISDAMNTGKFVTNACEDVSLCAITLLVGLFFLVRKSPASLRAIAMLD
jgi:hypothetical protein